MCFARPFRSLSHRAFAWLLLAGLAGAGCNEELLASLQPQAQFFDPSVEPLLRPESGLTVLDFGAVPVGATQIRSLGIANLGAGILFVCVSGTELAHCTQATGFEGGGQQFGIAFENLDPETGAWTVQEGSEREVAVRFTPSGQGPQQAELRLVHNGVGQTTLVVRGQGVEPNIEVSAEMLDFGEVTVGERKPLPLVLTNQTGFEQPVRAEAFLQDMRVFGLADSSGREVAVDQPWQGILPGNGSATVQVWFQPPTDVEHTNTLRVTFCPTCERTVAVRGVGVKPVFRLEPVALAFGDVPEGTPQTRRFTIINDGSVDLEVRSIAVEPGTSEEFVPHVADGAPLPLTLAPGETRAVDVTYTGATPGEDVGRIEVVTNAWEDTANENGSRPVGYVSVSATAIGPDINPFPPQVRFGVVSVLGQGRRRLSLQNSGNAPLRIDDLRMTGSPDFQISRQTWPQTVGPGEFLDFDLTYAPQEAGVDEAVIEVDSNDRDESTLSIEVSGVGGVPTTCSISVAPSQVTFGLVERGRTAILPVEIRNVGAEPCSVTDVQLSGAPEFTLVSAVPSATQIPSGGVVRVPVAYAPTAYGDHTTTLTFRADDPAQDSVQVPISGSSAVSALLVVPSSVDFNVVPVTCWSPERQVIIYNTGSSGVTLTNVYLDASTTTEFELVPVATPLLIPGGESALVRLYYRPRDIGQDTGVLFIASTAGSAPVAVPLAGDGRVNATVTDTFQQLATPQVDVLFVVDDSGSMSEEQRNLGANLGAFVGFADQQGIDYQIAVTTTDVSSSGERGRFVPVIGTPGSRIITPATVNPRAAFERNTNVGTTGSGTERGLEAAYLALSDPLINTHNAGFLRPQAALGVVFVSDEIDSSDRSVGFYENFLRNIKGFQNRGMLSVSAVVGTDVPSCASPDGRADYAPRYITVANNTGGVVESICSANWGQTLSAIGRNSFGLRRQFVLSSQPVVQTIAVAVDGQAVPSIDGQGTINWQYDAAANLISFSPPATPAGGASITATYTVACLSRP